MNPLFSSQVEMADPFPFLDRMRKENPIHRDEDAQQWAIFSYQDCKTVLDCEKVRIPEPNPQNKDGLNEQALLLSAQFARLANGSFHELARQAAMVLIEGLNPDKVHDAMEKMLSQHPGSTGELDWVDAVCKKLAVHVVSMSFQFREDDERFIQGNIDQLIAIMSPLKTSAQSTHLNSIAGDLLGIVQAQVLRSTEMKAMIGPLIEKYQLSREKVIDLITGNLIGLFIQAHEASRGLLSNTLLQIFRQGLPRDASDKPGLRQAVIETLRFDPPNLQTGRVAAEDFNLGGSRIVKGDAIRVWLASANRDPGHFHSPGEFDIHRPNNGDHLSYGSGGHMCVGKYFSVNLTVEALSDIFRCYPNIELQEQLIEYESNTPLRLIKKMRISLSPQKGSK